MSSPKVVSPTPAFNSRIGKRYSVTDIVNPGIFTGLSTLTKSDLVIIQQLAEEFVDRSKKSIQTWRENLETADDPKRPNWSGIMDLYEYLRPDGHLGSQMDIRKGITEACRYYIRDSKTGKELSDKTKLLETEWFFNMLGDLLDHIFFAFTVLQITDPASGKYDLIPRRNFVPQRDMVLTESTGEKGILITDPAIAASIVVIKNQYKFGILNDIVPDLIWKKTSRQCWAEFSQKFGIPLTTATTNTRDKKELDRIEAMLRALGRAAQAVFPQGTTLDVKDTAAKGDPYNVFLKQMEYSDGQISKRILGGTMVSDNGSSRSQSEVHQDTLNYIIAERDKKKIEFCINNQVLPILRAGGFPFAETDEFVFDRSEDLTLDKHWEMVAKALELGYEIPDEWVSETFNFPITGRKAPAPAQAAPAPAPVTPANAEARFTSFFN